MARLLASGLADDDDMSDALLATADEGLLLKVFASAVYSARATMGARQ